jgi:pyrroloquinoline quinone biosynthesis protein E
VEFAAVREELDTEEWTRIFAEAADLGVVQVHFSGGEPSLRADLPELVQRARDCDLYTNLVTGGTLLDEERLRALRERGLDHVQLSLQDVDPVVADRIAGTPSAQRKLETARAIRRTGLPLTLNFVVHRLNIDRVEAMIALAAELGAGRLELASTQFYGWALTNRAALLPTRDQVEAAEAAVRRARERYQGQLEIAYVKPDYYTGYPKPCMGGWARTHLCVTPNGEVLPCQAAKVIPRLRFESVRERSLRAIWEDSPAFAAFRGDAWFQEPCRSCPRREIDFGGCRCQAFQLAGDASAADPVCHLSPHHGIVTAAVREAIEGPSEWVYRDARQSLRFSRSPRCEGASRVV